MMPLVWLWRAEVCLDPPEVPAPPGEPAQAPILPSLAVCAKRPFRFLALTVWDSRRRSMSWAIGDLYRFSLLNLGSLGRFFAQNIELCAAASTAAWQPRTHWSDGLWVGDLVPVARVGGGRLKPAAARVSQVFLGTLQSARRTSAGPV